MPTYDYHAIRTEGDNSSEKSFVGGVVVAKDRQEAKAKLREQGLKANHAQARPRIMAVIKWLDADIR